MLVPFKAKKTNNVFKILLRAKNDFKQYASQSINNKNKKPTNKRIIFKKIKKKKISFKLINRK